MISLKLDAKTELLRKEFTVWLQSNPPPKTSGRISLENFVEISREWQRTLAAERWVGVHWPEKYGGRGLTIIEEAVVQECLAQAGSPQLINLFGLTMVGPAVMIAMGMPGATGAPAGTSARKTLPVVGAVTAPCPATALAAA